MQHPTSQSVLIAVDDVSSVRQRVGKFMNLAKTTTSTEKIKIFIDRRSITLRKHPLYNFFRGVIESITPQSIQI